MQKTHWSGRCGKVYNLIKGHTYFREILSNIPEKQKALLYAIAGEGEAERITSSGFIKRHGLTSASSVQSAAKKSFWKRISLRKPIKSFP